jgi:hypothetical protein
VRYENEKDMVSENITRTVDYATSNCADELEEVMNTDDCGYVHDFDVCYLGEAIPLCPTKNMTDHDKSRVRVAKAIFDKKYQLDNKIKEVIAFGKQRMAQAGLEGKAHFDASLSARLINDDCENEWGALFEYEEHYNIYGEHIMRDHINGIIDIVHSSVFIGGDKRGRDICHDDFDHGFEFTYESEEVDSYAEWAGIRRETKEKSIELILGKRCEIGKQAKLIMSIVKNEMARIGLKDKIKLDLSFNARFLYRGYEHKDDLDIFEFYEDQYTNGVMNYREPEEYNDNIIDLVYMSLYRPNN